MRAAAAAALASLPAAALSFSCGDLATCTTNPCNAVGPAGTQVGHCYGVGAGCDCMRITEGGERARIANATVAFKDATIKVTDECAAKSEGCKAAIAQIDCPTSQPQPLVFDFSGAGTLSEDVDTADLHVTAKALGIKVLDKTMSACGSQTIELPAGAGAITLKLIDCPAKAGSSVAISGHVAAKDSLPLGSLNIAIVATDASGAKLVDLNVVVKA